MNLKGTDLRGSQLDGLQAGIEDLRGAIIGSIQLIDLASDLARLLGLKVRDPDDPVKDSRRR